MDSKLLGGAGNTAPTWWNDREDLFLMIDESLKNGDFEMTGVMELVQAVNEQLLRGEPDNISIDEHSGYTGYKPQYIVDAMNEVFGIGGWGFEEVSSEIVLPAAGDKGGLAIAQVRVWLKDISSQPVGWGQNRVTRGDIGDARKGAQTDAIKKALSYFSIGNRAYKGLLPDKPAARNTSQSQQNGRRAAQPVPQSNGTQAPRAVAQDRLNAIYNRGKRAGLYANAEEFEVFAQRSLGLDAPIEAKQLTEVQAKDVEAKIAGRERQASPATKAS